MTDTFEIMKFVWLLLLLSVIVTINYAISKECPQCYCCSGNCKTWEDPRCTDACTEETCPDICAEYCETCITNATCAVCEDGFYKESKSDNDTNSGYYKLEELCMPCSRGCLVCSKSDNCTECKPGFVLNGTSCHYCPSNCLTCSELFLCDVCISGHYGQICENQCSKDCSNLCDIVTGECPVDRPNGTASECDECKEVTPTSEVPVTANYADCPRNCEKCNETGKCLSCKIGYWDTACDKICSPGCLNETCDSDTGDCSLVPSDEFNNTIIEITECPDGYYGERCNLTCSNHCRRSLCDMTSGDCVDGCNETFYGKKCDKKCENKCVHGSVDCLSYNQTCTCDLGYFGETCNRTCPSSCSNSTCHIFNGNCLDGSLGCKDGDNCNNGFRTENDVSDVVTAKLIIGGVIGSFGVAMATIVVVVILILRMKLRRVRAALIA